MDRRDFLKALSVTGAAAAGGISLPGPASAGALDIGVVKSVKVDVLSETSWFDNERFKKSMMDYGGAATNQYTIPWEWDNAGGYSALITVTTLGGEQKRILLDTGWNTEWMDYVYQRHGIDRMLQRGEIDFMVLSHWHLDHFWGIESTLKHNPNLKIYAPKTHFPEDLALLRDKAEIVAETKSGGKVRLCRNSVPHTGQLVLTDSEGEGGRGIYQPIPGMAIRLFDVPILLRVRGENVMFFNVQDRGIVTVTGCCHPGILSLFSYARQNFANYRAYGCYGGLHLSLFETWDPKFDDVIKGVKAFKIEKMACNHCTGWLWAEKAAAEGVPVVRGSDAYKSYPKQSTVATDSHVYLTNGDAVVF